MDDTTQKAKFGFSPKNFFLHIGGLISLYASIVLFLTLVYAIITITVGDNFYAEGTASAIRFGVSGIIVSFPIFIAISVFLGRLYREDKKIIETHTKRWAGYLTIFLAGLALAIDLITVVYNLLEGATTASFLLKALSVFVVLGALFVYQLHDIKREDYSDRKYSKNFAIVTSVVVFAFIVAGFVFAGSPDSVRKEKRDEVRVYDLRDIQWSLTSYWQQKGELPENLAEVEDPLSGRSVPSDPNGADYTYIKTGDQTFTLCAEFETEDLSKDVDRSRGYLYQYDNDNFFDHTKGEVCFDREIDEDIYPVNSDSIKPVHVTEF